MEKYTHEDLANHMKEWGINSEINFFGKMSPKFVSGDFPDGSQFALSRLVDDTYLLVMSDYGCRADYDHYTLPQALADYYGLRISQAGMEGGGAEFELVPDKKLRRLRTPLAW